MSYPTLFNPNLKTWEHATEQFPVWGFSKPDIQLAAATLRFADGTTGVATIFGVNTIGATRVGTGFFRVQVPKAVNFHVFDSFNVPTVVGSAVATGVGYARTISHKSVSSGTFDFHVTASVGTGIGAYGATGTHARVNPPPNAEASFFFVVESLADY